LNGILKADDGYRLWLKYDRIPYSQLGKEYQNLIRGWLVIGESETMTAVRAELETGLNGLLGKKIPALTKPRKGCLIACVGQNLPDGVYLSVPQSLDSN